jgi:glycosyltransferase involved in cell wall biosynthesis
MAGPTSATAIRGQPAASKIVALPRDRNPYQRLLYEQIEGAGHPVRYAGALTPSHTLNLLLLPIELAGYRLAEWRILHLHWTYIFRLTGSDRFPWLRRVAQAWFAFVLAVAHVLGMRVVWTAHNVLPNQPIFHDEIAARRLLVKRTELVLAHSASALQALDELGIRPARSAIIPLGPLQPELDASTLRPPGADGARPLKLLFFGQVLEYKGVEDLLEAVAAIPSTAPVRLLVAGQCRDALLAERLHDVALRAGERVELRLERIPDDVITATLADCDVVVLPFRRVTTSTSALFAMEHGRVVVLPTLPAFATLPTDAVVFYDGTVDNLERVIIDLTRASPERLQKLGSAARAYVARLSWADTARQTLAAIGGSRA